MCWLLLFILLFFPSGHVLSWSQGLWNYEGARCQLFVGYLWWADWLCFRWWVAVTTSWLLSTTLSPSIQISTSFCGWFVLVVVQRRVVTLRRLTTSLLRVSSVWTMRVPLRCSTVSCTRYATTASDKSTQNKYTCGYIELPRVWIHYCIYSWKFLRDPIFVVFVVDRPSTKLNPRNKKPMCVHKLLQPMHARLVGGMAIVVGILVHTHTSTCLESWEYRLLSVSFQLMVPSRLKNIDIPKEILLRMWLRRWLLPILPLPATANRSWWNT